MSEEILARPRKTVIERSRRVSERDLRARLCVCFSSVGGYLLESLAMACVYYKIATITIRLRLDSVLHRMRGRYHHH